jgi:hypothetical protein
MALEMALNLAIVEPLTGAVRLHVQQHYKPHFCSGMERLPENATRTYRALRFHAIPSRPRMAEGGGWYRRKALTNRSQLSIRWRNIGIAASRMPGAVLNATC